jgi:hypothetical protein
MILVVIFLVVFVVMGALTHLPAVGIILGAVVTIAYWVYDVKRHQKVACRVCGGSGDKLSAVQGALIRRPRGPCGHCGGKKGFPRPGLRIVNSGQHKKLTSEIKRAKEQMKQ